MKTWKKPEVTKLDVDQTLLGIFNATTESYDNFFSFVFGGPGSS